MWVLVYAFLLLPLAAITGGIAGALVGGGKEDRPIWLNSLIGFGGWTIAWVTTGWTTGQSMEELSIGLIVFAVAASAVLIMIGERVKTELVSGQPVHSDGRSGQDS